MSTIAIVVAVVVVAVIVVAVTAVGRTSVFAFWQHAVSSGGLSGQGRLPYQPMVLRTLQTIWFYLRILSTGRTLRLLREPS